MSEIKTIIKNNVRIFLTDVTNICQQVISKNEYLPLASLTLSTAMSAFGVFSLFKKGSKTSATIKCVGPLNMINVETSGDGYIRGMVKTFDVATDYDDNDINLIPINVGIGDSGTLNISSDYKGNNSAGEVPLMKSDISTDLAYYFHQSEQIFSAVVCHVEMKDKKTVVKAYSAIFQLLPDNTEFDIIWIEQFIKNNKLSKMTLSQYEKKIDGKMMEQQTLKWRCNCSDEQFESILNSMTKAEQDKIILDHGKLEIKCNYCGNTHVKFA